MAGKDSRPTNLAEYTVHKNGGKGFPPYRFGRKKMKVAVIWQLSKVYLWMNAAARAAYSGCGRIIILV
jgi:hypothetical protein